MKHSNITLHLFIYIYIYYIQPLFNIYCELFVTNSVIFILSRFVANTLAVKSHETQLCFILTRNHHFNSKLKLMPLGNIMPFD